ncbi:hypothetical protein [Bartonella sp. CB60]|uniref:hypothetical protein n=1 Tax=Bartonella sp. CB60 TaxID=3113619 RepID=UPI00300E55BD
MKLNDKIHHRTKLRHCIVEMLKAEDSLMDVQIFCNRTAPVHEEVLPCILVRSDSERMDEQYSMDYGGRSRTTTITIECRVAEKSGDDVADKLAMTVEQALYKNPRLSGLVFASKFVSTEFSFSMQGELPIYAVNLNFEFEYLTEYDPDDAREINA